MTPLYILSSRVIQETHHFDGTGNIESLMGDLQVAPIGEPYEEREEDSSGNMRLTQVDGTYHTQDVTTRITYSEANGLQMELTGREGAVRKVLKTVENAFPKTQ